MMRCSSVCVSFAIWSQPRFENKAITLPVVVVGVFDYDCVAIGKTLIFAPNVGPCSGIRHALRPPLRSP